MKPFLAYLIALVSASALATAEPPRPMRLDAIRRGMSTDEVKQLLGPPSRVARQVLFRRYVEQWQYDQAPGYIEFAVPRGDAAYVLNLYPGRP